MVRPKGWGFEGRWDISNSTLLAKYTNAIFWNYTNNIALGHQSSWKILQLNADELVFDTNDVAGVWKRKN